MILRLSFLGNSKSTANDLQEAGLNIIESFIVEVAIGAFGIEFVVIMIYALGMTGRGYTEERSLLGAIGVGVIVSYIRNHDARPE